MPTTNIRLMPTSFFLQSYWLTLAAFLPLLAQTQDLGGAWEGTLSQEGRTEPFRYGLDLTRTGDRVNGFAWSVAPDSSSARFEVGGIWDGQRLTLQEVRQLSPAQPAWCLKHIRLVLSPTDNSLHGPWEAQGCRPGTLHLHRPGTTPPPKPDTVAIDATPDPLARFHGRWTGRLAQSDRDYGFYLEMDLLPDGTGSSLLHSDGEGGSVRLALSWSWDEDTRRLSFRESSVTEQSVPAWRWCLKSGSLALSEQPTGRFLSGPWDGFIEHYDPASGPCAPGSIHLEKPILPTPPAEPVQVAANPATTPALPALPNALRQYESEQGRKVQVGQTLAVRNKTVRIRVWDNGTVDGDVCSLFLNGRMILRNYRVARSKHETIVTLDDAVNFLVLHAINLGSISPNTIAVSVDDGFQEQMVIVSSNLAESGAIMIREFTVH
jgi:hypothetical protein